MKLTLLFAGGIVVFGASVLLLVQLTPKSESILDQQAKQGRAAIRAPGQLIEVTPSLDSVPPAILRDARTWSPQTITLPPPAPNEQTPVRAYAMAHFDASRPGPPPNPFVPPQPHLSDDDIRAGLRY